MPQETSGGEALVSPSVHQLPLHVLGSQSLASALAELSEGGTRRLCGPLPSVCALGPCATCGQLPPPGMAQLSESVPESGLRSPGPSSTELGIDGSCDASPLPRAFLAVSQSSCLGAVTLGGGRLVRSDDYTRGPTVIPQILPSHEEPYTVNSASYAANMRAVCSSSCLSGLAQPAWPSMQPTFLSASVFMPYVTIVLCYQQRCVATDRSLFSYQRVYLLSYPCYVSLLFIVLYDHQYSLYPSLCLVVS